MTIPNCNPVSSKWAADMFVEVTRKGGLTLRVRADSIISAADEMLQNKETKEMMPVLVIVDASKTTYQLVNETMISLFAKMTAALGKGNIMVVGMEQIDKTQRPPPPAPEIVEVKELPPKRKTA